MIEAILFDLDNTLLHNDIRAFTPPYFALVARRMADLIPPEAMRRRLELGAQAMLANEGGSRTNEDVFMDVFFEGLAVERSTALARFAEFYQKEFDSLRGYTKPKAKARPLLAEVFRQGYRVIVATQPMFPLLAIQKRLAWAGLADFLFEYITSYEVMHACKPFLRYYREIAERLVLRPEACLMVGDSPENDLVAAEMGMRVFWVTDSLGDDRVHTGVKADGEGDLDELHHLVKSGALRHW
jgi:HAD superfamily hydrolase (TIGR01509 family)